MVIVINIHVLHVLLLILGIVIQRKNVKVQMGYGVILGVQNLIELVLLLQQ